MKTRLQLGITTAFCSFGLTLCNGGSGLPALAETHVGVVRRISILEATGQEGESPALIQLSSGYGVNISFIPTDETVEKVWFDNPSFATLDVDGCLLGLGGQQEQECQSEGATVLHLRQINPLDFPNLPKTNSTLLTVITSSSAGRRVYLFRVAAGEQNPQYHTVEITPPTTAASSGTRYRSVIDSVADWQLFNRGLTVAQQKRLVRVGQPLWNRIQDFLSRVRAGEPTESAAAVSGISLNLVRRLEELGRTDISGPASSVQPFSLSA